STLVSILTHPAAGTLSTCGWHFYYLRLAIALPAAGNRITCGWQSHCLRLAIALPAAGNRITRGWQSHYPRLAIVLPRALAIFCTYLLLSGKVLRGGGWQKAIPNPT
ncbi:MAG: hypothetical protein MR037_00670, partial [Bacteroidales bacterium]|nr:hypothetical protein [Bacteroidales bacterium]